jgi:hypothetical protein
MFYCYRKLHSGMKEDNPREAIDEFQAVVDAETEPGDW